MRRGEEAIPSVGLKITEYEREETREESPRRNVSHNLERRGLPEWNLTRPVKERTRQKTATPCHAEGCGANGLEPAVRFELTACALRKHCSTTELSWRVSLSRLHEAGGTHRLPAARVSY